jgi:ATP-dependent RNA helicase DDX60
MHSGILHKICAQGSTIDAKREYVHLMSHLFGRRYISRITMKSETMSNLRRTYPSMVVLPPLSKSIRKALNSHGQDVLDIFVAYVVAYSKDHASRLGPGDCLPLSGIRYTKADYAPFKQARLNQYLEKTAIEVTARSIFVANSGHGDHFGTISELAQTVRQGIYLNEHAIPSTAHLVTGGTKEYDLNAYLLDFYTHGQTASLIKANGIRANDVWYLLEDFSLILALVKAALEQMFTANAKAIYERGKGAKIAESSSNVNLDEEDEVWLIYFSCFTELIGTLIGCL